MMRDPVSADSSLFSALRTFRRPWPILLAGLACTVLSLVLSQTSLVPLRLLLLGAGILLAGIAVARRLQTASWEALEDRAESAGLLAISFFLTLLAYLAMEPSWDSGRTFLGVLMIVTLLGSGIVLLPRSGRRIAAVVLVLLHFGGIITAVTSVPPRNELPAPWLSMQLWTYFYRPYLMFTYLTNAYHFYSPDPGPPTLLWFHIEYANGSARWFKIPNRHDSPVGLHHQRMLATTESVNIPIMGPPLLNSALVAQWEQTTKQKYELLPGIPHDTGEEIVKRRQLAATLIKFVDPSDGREAPLMMLNEPLWGGQYSEPQDMAKRLLVSYARHVAHSFPDPNDPHNPVKAVRIYRVVHNLITPRELNEGKDPLDLTTFLAHYMGKYDPEGRLLDPKDPFLFWHIPYARVPKRFPEPGTFEPTPDGPVMVTNWDKPGEPTKIIDFVEIHATQSDKFQNETAEK